MTRGSKLRSLKRVVIMNAGKPKFVMEYGDTKVETYFNDIGLHPETMVGVSHVKEILRGHIKFGFRDTVLTQTKSKNNGETVESVTFEIERELRVVTADNEKSMADKMENLITSDTPSSIETSGVRDAFASG